ncbi:MAG: cytochrome c peroxidase [Woeseiaceae bacterium]|nr:cytochrome c peroxidase [Woeseiaceae bacterium]
MSKATDKRRRWLYGVLVAGMLALAWEAWLRYAPVAEWSDDERAQLDELWIGNLPPVPADPSNAVADDPDAAAFGHKLFFDPRLSANGMISCATCHQPIRRFSDGLPRGVAIGMSKRNTPSIVGAAYSPWLYWDGRKDSLWSQALSPLEDPNEHGSSRMQVLHVVASVSGYRNAYEALFGAPPDVSDPAAIDRAFANVGKAIAAYERLLLPGESRFDRYVEHLQAGGDHVQQEFLTREELRGLRLFIGDARCTECHNGPLFTNNEFHNTGLLSAPGETPDRGRIDGMREVASDPFNCLGAFSDDPGRHCPELTYMRTGVELVGATRTPSLRNLVPTAPFQSKGQHAELAAVLRHYNEAPPAMIGHNEAKELGLRDFQLRELEAFLATLDAPINADDRWLAAPAP